MSVSYQDNLKLGRQLPLDSRFSKVDSLGKYELYETDAEAKQKVPIEARYQGLTVGVKKSANIDGVATTVVEEWWWRKGIASEDLERKVLGSSFDGVDNGISLGNANPNNNKIILGGTLNQATTITTSANNTLALAGLTSPDAMLGFDFLIADNNGVIRKALNSGTTNNYQASDALVSATNGLKKSGINIKLGGDLTEITAIAFKNNTLTYNLTDVADENQKKSVFTVNKTLTNVPRSTQLEMVGIKAAGSYTLNETVDFVSSALINTPNYNYLNLIINQNGKIENSALNQGTISASHNEISIGNIFSSSCTFTASITGTTMTVTSVTSGTLAVGQYIGGSSSIPFLTTITALGTGSGGTGTYTISNSTTLSSTSILSYQLISSDLRNSVSALSTRLLLKGNNQLSDNLIGHKIMSPMAQGAFYSKVDNVVGLQIQNQRYHLAGPSAFNATQIGNTYGILQEGLYDINQFNGTVGFTNNVAIGIGATGVSNRLNTSSALDLNNIPLVVSKGTYLSSSFNDLTLAPVMSSVNSIFTVTNVSGTYKPGMVTSNLSQLDLNLSTNTTLTSVTNFSANYAYTTFKSLGTVDAKVGMATSSGSYVSAVAGQGLFSGKEIIVYGVNATTTSGVVTLTIPNGISTSQFAAGDLVRLQPDGLGTGATFDATDVNIEIGTGGISGQIITLKKADGSNIASLSGGTSFTGRTIIITKQGGTLDVFAAIRALPPVPSRYLGFKGTLTTAIGLQIDDQQNGVGSSYNSTTQRPTGTLTGATKDSYAILQVGLNDKVSFASNRVILTNLPTYANEAAADADTTLQSKALYKLSGSRIVYQKP